MMKKLRDLFDVSHGSKLDLNKMVRLPVALGGVPFVGRSGENHGVTATIAAVEGKEPFEAGSITVALGGSKLLSAFVQERPFYTAQNVAVLRPKEHLSQGQKIYICMCIRQNRFRYSAFGREANRTIKDLLIPDPSDFPAWVSDAGSHIGEIGAPLLIGERPPLVVDSWGKFRIGDVFSIKKGRRLIQRDREAGSTPFVGTSKKRNGIVGYVSGKATFPAGSITIPYNGQGGVGWACYQPVAFSASDDVQVLLPPVPADAAALLFVCVVLRCERYRYSFGRKWTLERLRDTVIRLPGAHEPDWSAMSNYLSHLPFASTAFGASKS